MYGYSYNNVFRKPSGGVSYSAEAQALFDTISTFPEVSKPYYAQIIDAFVDSGAWGESGFRCIMALPSADHDEQLIELKTLVKVSDYKTNAGAAYTTPFDTNNNRVGARGFEFNSGIIDTGFNRSTLSSTSSNGFILSMYKTLPSYDSACAGAATPSQFATIAPLRNTSEYWVENWDSSVNGRHKYTSATGTPGLYSWNRRTDIDAEIRIDGAVVQTEPTRAGTPPNLVDYLNTYNNNGTPAGVYNRSPISMYAVLGAGLPTATMDALESEIISGLEGLGLIKNNHANRIILDGNSHLMNHWAKIPRMVDLSFAYGGGSEVINFGVSGGSTSNMVSLYPAKVRPFVDASTIVVGFEITNHISIGASAVTAHNKYIEYANLVTADGGKFIACQIMARGGSYSEADAQKLQDVNNLIRDNWASYADAYVTAPSWSYREQGGSESDADYATALDALTANGTYYQADAIHLTEIGYADWAEMTGGINETITSLI